MRASRRAHHLRGARFVAREMVGTLALCPPYGSSRQSHLRRAVHHPGDAELIDAHAKTLGEEGLAERHVDAAAIGQRLEAALGIGGILDLERYRKTLRL